MKRIPASLFITSLLMVTAGIGLLAACSKGGGPVAGDNLIHNGGAEASSSDSVPPGWINIQGHWRSVEGDSITHAYAWAREGKRHFFEGQDLFGVLQQDIDVSELAAAIDEKKQSFVFSGYTSVFPQQPPDQARIVLETFADPKGKALYHFDSDTISSQGKWQFLTDTFTAPAGTRTIRIQLIAQRRNGADNDGYFDDLRLTTPSAGHAWLWLLAGILALVLAAIGIRLAILKRRSSVPA